MDLRDKAVHLLEGEDVFERQCVSCVYQPVDEHPHSVEWRVRPIGELIRRGEKGRLTALDCIALILFAVRESFAPEDERQIVESWGAELRAAAASGEVVARHPVTWLPLRELPESWDWLVALEEADAFVKARGMGWTCAGIVEHIATELVGAQVTANSSGTSPDAHRKEVLAAGVNDDDALAALFDAVTAQALETMFPDGGKWESHTERAARNGLGEAAKENRAVFNPYRAAQWWLRKQAPAGWDWARCLRRLANNLPARSLDSRHLLTGDFD